MALAAAVESDLSEYSFESDEEDDLSIEEDVLAAVQSVPRLPGRKSTAMSSAEMKFVEGLQGLTLALDPPAHRGGQPTVARFTGAKQVGVLCAVIYGFHYFVCFF